MFVIVEIIIYKFVSGTRNSIAARVYTHFGIFLEIENLNTNLDTKKHCL